MRYRERTKLAAAGVVLALCLSSCTWTSGHDYFLESSLLEVTAVLRLETTWSLHLARGLFAADNFAAQAQYLPYGFQCYATHGSNVESLRCVMWMIWNQGAYQPPVIKEFWYAAADPTTQYDDFRSAYIDVDASVNVEDETRCLAVTEALFKDPNWTIRTYGEVAPGSRALTCLHLS